MALPNEQVIEGLISEFLASRDPRYDWLRRSVERHKFLPTYIGFVSVLGVRPDGGFVRWDNESASNVVRPITNAFLERMAAFQGALRYPQLSSLLPERPGAAMPCDGPCGGTGQLPGHLVCSCGGAGWIVPGEEEVTDPWG